MKVLVIGGSGMLGHKLVHKWRDKFDLWSTVRTEYQGDNKDLIFDSGKTLENIDIEDFSLVEKAITEIKPDVIVNAVGIIKQLPTAKSVIKTLTINSIFPHRLAEISQAIGARLITISTDCVFNGRRGNYSETDIPDAEDLYGKSKQLGEVVSENCLTIRTSIIGRELSTAHSLLEWFLNNRNKEVKGYKKAVFSGFPTVILADIIADIIVKHPKLEGLYHISSNPINKFELLQLINEAYQVEKEIVQSDTVEIDRSLNSARFRQETGFEPLEWNEMIEIMAKDNNLYENKELL